MAALFGHVWDTGDLGRNMRGGSGLLPDALGASLGPIVRLGTRVTSVSLDGAGVRVAYTGPDGAGEIGARTAIVAVPAPHLPGVLGDAITPELRRRSARDVRADGRAQHPHGRDEPMPWDDLYSVLTPDKRFNMFFNHANSMHGAGAEAGQRAHGLRRRPARPRAARGLRGRRPRRVPGRPRPHVSRRCGGTSPRRGSRSGSTPARSPRPGAGALRRRSSAASPTASSWPATGSASSSRWRRPR